MEGLLFAQPWDAYSAYKADNKAYNDNCTWPFSSKLDSSSVMFAKTNDIKQAWPKDNMLNTQPGHGRLFF